MKSWDDLRWWKSPHKDHVIDSLFQAHAYKRVVLPPYENLYKAFDLTPLDKVKVVILGQDPYHTPGMAHGLAFSVPPHVKNLPPSLRNIYREYQDDLGYPRPRFGDLTPWAKEGVLLLNTVLTVESGKPLSHRGMGWEKLTIEVLITINEFLSDTVCILWGQQAQEYQGLLTRTFNITAPHPSPFSANKGFFGHKPFTRANDFLQGVGIKPVNWRLP